VISRVFPLSAKEREKARELTEKLETAGVLKKSKSKYCSSAFLKMKKSGEPRLLFNYKPLNERIASDNFNVCRIEPMIEALQNAKMYCTMDLLSGYYQFPLEEKSQHLTAFRLDSCPLYEFTTCPQGLKISSSATTRAVYSIFQPFLYKSLVAYLDDLCSFSQSFHDEIKIWKPF